MHVVEILLPLSSGSGAGVPPDRIEELVAGLAERFGGATAFTREPAEGLWQNAGAMQKDRIVVVEVMVDEVDGHWWQDYRRWLEREFDQEEILIRAVPCRKI